YISCRRRHTSCYHDCSSDVCSSDLEAVQRIAVSRRPEHAGVPAEVEPVAAEDRQRSVHLPAAENGPDRGIRIGPALALAERQLVDVAQGEVVPPIEIELLPVAPWIDVEAQAAILGLVTQRFAVGVRGLDQEPVRESAVQLDLHRIVAGA